MSLEHPIVSIGLVLGSLSMMLVLLWLRVCRLTALIRRRDQRIKVLAQGEALTGLANRKTFCRQGEKLLKKHPSATVSLLSLNINRFKLINDGLGHAVGDALLQQLGQRLLSCIGPKDMVAVVYLDSFGRSHPHPVYGGCRADCAQSTLPNTVAGNLHPRSHRCRVKSGHGKLA